METDMPRQESEGVPLPQWPSYGKNGGNTRGPSVTSLTGPTPRDDVAGLGSSATIRSVGPVPTARGQEITLASGIQQEVTLEIYDVAGRLVRRLFHGQIDKGMTQVTWDGNRDNGTRAASGIYWYRLSWRTGAESRRVVILH